MPYHAMIFTIYTFYDKNTRQLSVMHKYVYSAEIGMMLKTIFQSCTRVQILGPDPTHENRDPSEIGMMLKTMFTCFQSASNRSKTEVRTNWFISLLFPEQNLTTLQLQQQKQKNNAICCCTSAGGSDVTFSEFCY